MKSENNMDRKAEKDILAFIENSPNRESSIDRKCLLIDGLRQVGKTYSIRRCLGFREDDLFSSSTSKRFSFGMATCIYIALDKMPDALSLIDRGYPPEELLTQLNLLPRFLSLDLKPRKDNRIILAIDEIGMSDSGLNQLKYLSMVDGLTVIASGSMLGILKNKEGGYPIGYVELLRMYPLDFEEFLWAGGYNDETIGRIIGEIAKGHPLPSSLHEELSLAFKRYVLVGGLPAFVKEYAKGIPSEEELYFKAADRVEEYRGDIAKYGSNDTKLRGREIFSSILTSLSRPSTRFFYSDIKKGAKGREYRAPMEWLLEAGLAYRIHNVKRPESPIALMKDEDSFKLYYADPSMVYGQLGPSSYRLIMDDLPSIGKGAIYENAACAILYPLSRGQLYYYSRDTGLEIDFLMEIEGKIAFLEIKSSLNAKSKSLQTILEECPNALGIRLSYRQNGLTGNLWSLPLYMLPFVTRVIKASIH